MWLKLLLGPLLIWQGRQVRTRALRLPEAQGPRSGRAEAGDGGLPSGAPAAGPGPTGRPGAAPLRLLVVGDSSAAGVGVEHQHQALAAPLAAALARRRGGLVTWQLLATTGHTVADALAALRRCAEAGELLPADLLVTAVGVNDVVAQTPPATFLARLDALHDTAVAQAGVRLSLHSAVPPMGRFPLLPQPLRAVLGRDARRLDAALRRHVQSQADRRHVPLPAAPGDGGGAPPPGWMARDGFHPGPAGYPVWAEALAAAVPAAALS